jgi:PKD repeat protein
MRKYYFILFLIVFYTCKREDLETNVKACFDFSPESNLKIYDSIQFSNCSENAEKYIWDFGDGNYSFDKNPKHSYTNHGNYKIRLAVLKDNIMDTISKNLIVNRKPDRIIYTSLNPQISLKSIDSTHQDGSSNPYCPLTSVQTFPSRGNANCKLDLDSNAINDFVVQVYHQPITCDSYSNCTGYDYYTCVIKISGTNTENSVFVDWLGGGYSNKIFGPNDTIDFGSTNGLVDWSALLDGSCTPAFRVSLNDGYIGVKINKNFGWIHLVRFTNGIIIKDFAINMTEYNPIIAGQRK